MKFMSSARLAVLASAVALAAVPAAASVTLTYSAIGLVGVDAAFEGPGGYLNGVRGLPLVPPANVTALPPIERAVGQLRQGATDRRGLFMPQASTGIPVADGGTGVTTALTNASAYASSTVDFQNGVATPFSIARVGNIITFTTLNTATGVNIVLSSNARNSIAEINAIELRIRSEANLPANGITFTGITFTDSATPLQSLGSASAADGQVLIKLWEGIAPGDFSFSGSIVQSWTVGQRPGGSALATQLKLLALPPLPVIPEPGTWAMLIAGFGMVGSALRRRRVALGC
jgi:hypothetical protein